jgi:IS5 family transposase
MPDETTILNFRHLLEKHQLAESLFQEVVALLTERGFMCSNFFKARRLLMEMA